jgi:dienelactone hydrolase
MKASFRSTVWVSLVCCATLAACGESVDPQSSTRTITATATPTSVTRSERRLVDTSRATAHNGNYAGAPDRTLRTLIWQPATAGPLPLFVMAHGFGGLPEKFEAMARTIADAGFIVAAPAFPLTNENALGGYMHGLQDVANQPGDVSFVIDQLLLANAAPGDALQNRILPDEIAVLGHSLGGTTVAALTRKNCCRDNRVRASILFAAGPLDVFTNLFGPDPITAGPPTLILHGTVDSTVTFATSQRLYSEIDPPRFFVGITGADHSDAIEAQTEPLTSIQLASERAIVAFLNAMFRGANTQLSNTLAALAAEGNPVENDGTLP